MKNLSIFTALALLLCAVVPAMKAFAEEPPQADSLDSPDLFDWSLLWDGKWEPSSGQKMLTYGNLHNRTEVKLIFLPLDLTMRGQVLDRRPLVLDKFDFESITQNFDRAVTHYQGALYHNKTGSRLLYGALDEWGLSARIRNPWIRSPAYPENHKPLIADLKTAASSTKEDEVYIYLSSPFLNFSPKIKTRGFVSAQTEIIDNPQYRQSAASAGLDFAFQNNSNLLFETFYTWAVLPPTNGKSWFSDPPPLPQRDFNLYAAGVLFSNPFLSLSSDFALSETFAWGTDIYANLGISVSLPVKKLPFWDTGRIARPLTISFTADGAGNRFVYRDGADHGEAFRTAAKVELKGARNALLRFSTVLRAPESLSSDFRRSSTNFYYRLPAVRKDASFLRLTRISLTADRNADNNLKITDRLHGYAGFSLNLPCIDTPLGVVLNGSVRGITASESSRTEGSISPYPIPRILDSSEFWVFEDLAFYGEFTFSPSINHRNYQFKTRFGYSNDAKNGKKWDFSAGGSARFAKGRLSLKIASPELPDMWNFNISWRLELK